MGNRYIGCVKKDTKESARFRVIVEHEEILFCFWPFVKKLEVTTKLPLKLNHPVVDMGT
jgi:hypothetical protein